MASDRAIQARMRRAGAGPEGYAYPVGSSRQIAARLEWSDRSGGLTLVALEDGSTLGDAAPDEMRREPRLGNLAAEVVMPDGMRFQTDDHERLDALLGDGGGAVHRMEAFHPRLLVLVGLVLAAGYAVWRWGLAALVAVAVEVTPPEVLPLIDEGNMALLDRLEAEPTQLPENEQARLQRIFARLVANAPPSPSGEYRLLFRSWPELGPNAFALPGGTIVMLDEFVVQFPETDVIAGVLGHEIAHVSERHSLQQIYRTLGIYVLIALVAGDVGAVLEDALLEASLLASLAYSRGHESEADELGVRVAAESGFDPEGLADFFVAMEKKYGDQGPAWASTHPASSGRARDIRRWAQQVNEERN